MGVHREPCGNAQISVGASSPALSVVVPCYNEEAALPLFMLRMVAAAKAAAGSDFEIILINDGSRDRTWACIGAMTERYQQVLGVNLSRNCGHQIAVTAGLSLARGKQVLIIDADLQDPPELLSDMRKRIAEGYDVVYGKRQGRSSENRFKLFTANVFYRLLDKLSEVEIPADVGDFRLMSRKIVDGLNAMPEHDRFLRGMVAWLGGRQAEILYDRDPRCAGKTGYTMSKMLKLAVNGLIGFSTAPLNIAVVFALIGTVVGAAIVVYALTAFFLGHIVPGWTSLAIITVFFGVGQYGCLAVIGVYLGRIYIEVKGRPLFVIDELVSCADAKPDDALSTTREVQAPR